MTKGAEVGLQMVEQIAAVRAFNRFYTARLGLLRRRHLDGEFSLTEARILYEIARQPQMTATALRQTLELDAGYISRLLALLTRRRLVNTTASKLDGREKLLRLTAEGKKAVARLDAQSTQQIASILDGVRAPERKAMVAALGRVQTILRRRERVRIERLRAVNDDARAILAEYYEAVRVVQRDKPGSLEKLVHERGSGIWLAYLNDVVAGCVVLRRMEQVARAGECKRLYVKPAARGRGIAGQLLDAEEKYAREQGLEWIYLDSYNDLKTAIALYEQRGYTRCARYNDNPQATVFLRKQIG
jgi:DNA-binding MarR family transcriptional regulator/N-acetylglutamate synthase-like GNAT family acetyltransferase